MSKVPQMDQGKEFVSRMLLAYQTAYFNHEE